MRHLLMVFVDDYSEFKILPYFKSLRRGSGTMHLFVFVIGKFTLRKITHTNKSDIGLVLFLSRVNFQHPRTLDS